MLKGISIDLRDSRWHKAHMRKKLKRAAVAKSHDFMYRMFRGNGKKMNDAERSYQEARQREASIITSKNWFHKQYLKLKSLIIQTWQKLHLKK